MKVYYSIIILLISIIGISSCTKSKRCNNQPTRDLSSIDEENVEYYTFYNDTNWLKIPKYFTPNGDGVNDELQSLTNNLESFQSIEFQINNKCRDRLYWSNFPEWDGDQFGVAKYEFEIEIKWGDGSITNETGNIELLK
jgi:hypothetical protein